MLYATIWIRHEMYKFSSDTYGHVVISKNFIMDVSILTCVLVYKIWYYIYVNTDRYHTVQNFNFTFVHINTGHTVQNPISHMIVLTHGILGNF